MWFTFYHVELVPSFCHDFLAKRRLRFSHQQTVNVEQEILDAREEGARAWALLPYSIVLTKWSHIWNPRKSVPDIRRVTMDAPEVSTVIWHYMSPVTLRQFHNRINCFDNEFDENQTRNLRCNLQGMNNVRPHTTTPPPFRSNRDASVAFHGPPREIDAWRRRIAGCQSISSGRRDGQVRASA